MPKLNIQTYFTLACLGASAAFSAMFLLKFPWAGVWDWVLLAMATIGAAFTTIRHQGRIQ